MKIALTGGIACGKSLLSQFLNGLGVETLDADDIVHELLPDPAARRRLAAEVFADPAKRRALEARLHPVVRERMLSWLASGADGHGIRIAVIPLLFEVHWEKFFDIICCVATARDKQIERLETTRAMTRAEAEARLSAQLSVEEKARRSHYVIRNDGTPEELRAQARAFLAWLRSKTAVQPTQSESDHV